MNKAQSADVCILGGGLAGFTLALQLRERLPDASITVVERRTFPVPETVCKVGESTVEIGGHYFAHVLGFEAHIKEHQLPKLGLRYFFPHGENRAIEHRLELGGNAFYPTPSYQLDRGRFENVIVARALESNINVLQAHSVASVDLNKSGHTVRITDPSGAEFSVAATWVVDSTGRYGLIKRQLDLAVDCPHKVSAVWFRLDTSVRIDDWSDNQAWQERVGDNQGKRWLSTNHLIGAGYWVWLIPLASGSTSVGIVADTAMHPPESMDTFEKALEWLKIYEPQCAEKIEAERSTRQDFLRSVNFSHSAKRVFSTDRWCLTGEAGLFLDPFYSPGSDFIGISNTLVSELIVRDLSGKSYEAFVNIYNDLYFSIFDTNLTLFRHQYPIFGDTTVMPFKVIWDFAYYWSFPAYLFVQGNMCDVRLFKQFKDELEGLAHKNERMQQIFRDWHALPTSAPPEKMIDINQIPFMIQLNRNLSADTSMEQFSARLAENIERLHQFAAELERVFVATKDGKPVDLDQPLLKQVTAAASIDLRTQ